MGEREWLTEHEIYALAALLRVVIRADGKFSHEERRRLSVVASSIAQLPETSPSLPAESYRTASEPVQRAKPLGEKRLYALLDRAGREPPGEAAVRALARTITRPAARATIYALLFEVAASDVISRGEGAVLDWLAEDWRLAEARDLEHEASVASRVPR